MPRTGFGGHAEPSKEAQGVYTLRITTYAPDGLTAFGNVNVNF